MKRQIKSLYERPLNEVIDELLINTPLCASQEEEGFTTDNFEDDGTF